MVQEEEWIKPEDRAKAGALPFPPVVEQTLTPLIQRAALRALRSGATPKSAAALSATVIDIAVQHARLHSISSKAVFSDMGELRPGA